MKLNKAVCSNAIPISLKQLNDLHLIIDTLSVTQLAWISGYLWALVHVNNDKESNENTIGMIDNTSSKFNAISSIKVKKVITIISASQTGNARKVSKWLYDNLIAANIDVILHKARDFKIKQISKIVFLIIVISTYGEGEPPEEAIALYKYLFSHKAPRMEGTYFAVFSLGDRSYNYFAKAGKDLDIRLEELGASRLYNRVDADINFENIANEWIEKIVSLFVNMRKDLDNSIVQKNVGNNVALAQNTVVYCKNTPFVALLSAREKITSRNSLKDVHHLEINITGSNLHYIPGDTLGVWYENDMNLINELLEILHLSGNEQVLVNGNTSILSDVLKRNVELTQNTFVVVKNLADLTKNKDLLDLLNNEKELKLFISTTSIVDLFRKVCTSIKLDAQSLLQVLCIMKPRFYSIASAQLEVGEEVHITVGAVRYQYNGRLRTGGASGYLIDRLKENDKIRIFILSNDNFRLPKDKNVPIIMIGAGTGIAPFRAFIQQRAVERNSGKNWLFFGNLSFIDDFLYQVEWQKYIKDGVLTKINTAWSRDQIHKVYVQNKLLENSVELWSWIQEGGAHVYVCGDANRMARDVDKVLIQLTSEQGKMSLEEASAFWDNMRVICRYQRDIY